MRHAPCAMRHARCAMRRARTHGGRTFKQIRVRLIYDNGSRCDAVQCGMRDAGCAMRHAPCAMHARTHTTSTHNARTAHARTADLRARAHARRTGTHGGQTHGGRARTHARHTHAPRTRAFSSSPRSTPPRPSLSSPLWLSLFLNDEPFVGFQSVAKVSVSSVGFGFISRFRFHQSVSVARTHARFCGSGLQRPAPAGHTRGGDHY